MNATQFEPINDLERLLVRAATDPAARPEFMRKLLDSQVWLLTPNTPSEEGKTILSAGTQIQFVNLQGPNGVFLPLFSSQERLQETVNQLGVAYGFIAILGRDLFPVLAQSPPQAVLNPGAPYGKQFLPDEIRRIADGTIFRTEAKVVQRATTVFLGQPKEYPHAAVLTLQELFRKHASVEAAYLAWMHDPASTEPPHLVFGIECTGDYQSVIGEAGMAIQGLLGEGKFADFVQLGAGKGSFDSYFKRETRPFYQRADRKPWWKVW
ncbi:MAG: enhanced serine sensitivity protein SseB C-terminal domain-containing protein [Verrucomicrobia bacterium]|nr:enhanced serine sensitivity protein SseB C-terminal domain-containing protein [Verrucomicrobiota bacterium]